jgi:hypothetical protein
MTTVSSPLLVQQMVLDIPCAEFTKIAAELCAIFGKRRSDGNHTRNASKFIFEARQNRPSTLADI